MSRLALTFVILLQTPATQRPAPPQPRRDIPDPGTIATEQRVTPAGVQSVFTDRVFGVRFGKPGEVWVTVHGAASCVPARRSMAARVSRASQSTR